MPDENRLVPRVPMVSYETVPANSALDIQIDTDFRSCLIQMVDLETIVTNPDYDFEIYVKGTTEKLVYRRSAIKMNSPVYNLQPWIPVTIRNKKLYARFINNRNVEMLVKFELSIEVRN